MANSISSPALDRPRKPLRMRGESVQNRLVVDGETIPNPVRSDEFPKLIGRAIERALAASGITNKAAADVMGYGDNLASLSNWTSGKESPQFARLWRLGDRFREELVIALAHEAGGFQIETTLRRKRA